MARSAGEVKADIALTRQVIERDLDALHLRVPKRSWVSYSWLAGGVAAGLLLSQAPLLTLVNGGLRIAQLGTAILAMVGTLERVLAGVRSGDGDRMLVSGREGMHRNGNHTRGAQ
jgi:hypothetical protein